VDPRAIFGLSVLGGFVAWGLFAACWVWPRLRTLPRERALAILVVPHAFRFVGLSFLVEGVVAPSLPRGFAVPAAYGDLGATLLAMLAMVALDRRWSWAIAVVWLLNLWGAADLLLAFVNGPRVGLTPSMLGAAFFIPTALVPGLLTAHALSFRLLFARAAQRRAVAAPGSLRFSSLFW
jgi:hypothetical protein